MWSPITYRMRCIEDDHEAKYKCPACTAPYCSVACFKQHKLRCTPSTNPNKSEAPASTPTPVSEQLPPTSDPKLQKVVQNEKIRALLQTEAVRNHLKLIYEILTDAKHSGEQSAEGRRLVALKKLRELRKGGREANEAIEELVTSVLELW